MRHKALQVRHETHAQRILDVHALVVDQIAGDLSNALTEPNVVVVHREALRIVSHVVDACEQTEIIRYFDTYMTELFNRFTQSQNK